MKYEEEWQCQTPSNLARCTHEWQYAGNTGHTQAIHLTSNLYFFARLARRLARRLVKLWHELIGSLKAAQLGHERSKVDLDTSQELNRTRQKASIFS